MEPIFIVILLFVVGISILLAEVFIPSGGLLGFVGISFLIYGIYRAYGDISENAGHLSLLAAIILLPSLAFLAVKTFHRTPWGKKLAPANPVVRLEDFAPQYETLKDYIGQTGKTVTPLRPVGICMFDGRRVSSVAESGMIADNMEVEAIGIRGNELEVRPAERSA